MEQEMCFYNLSVFTALSFALAVFAVDAAPSAAFYLAPTRAWELGLGSLLALGLQSRRPPHWLLECASVVGLGSILTAIFFYNGETPFPGVAALLPCLGAAALIYAGAHGAPTAIRVLSFRPIVFLGLISYSLYLWHWPIFAFSRAYFGRIELTASIEIIAIAASFVIATLSWAYIEAPFRRSLPSGFQRSAIFKLSGVSMTALIVLTTSIWMNSGWPSRFSPEVLSIAASANEKSANRVRCLNVLPANGLCLFPETAADRKAIDFLLWGDSHADAIMPGVELAARNAGLVGAFVGKSACPPLVNVNRVDRGPGHNCSEFNDAVLNYIETQNDIQVVFLAARWALAAEGTRAFREEGKPAILAHAGTQRGSSLSTEQNFEIFRRGAIETIQSIRSTGRKVVLIGNIPEVGWNVPASLLAHIRWGTPLPPPPTIESVTRRQGRTEAVFAELAKEPGIYFLPIAPRMCNPVCQTRLEGQPLYRDDDHLSSIGAIEVIAPVISDALEHVLNQEAGMDQMPQTSQ